MRLREWSVFSGNSKPTLPFFKFQYPENGRAFLRNEFWEWIVPMAMSYGLPFGISERTF